MSNSAKIQKHKIGVAGSFTNQCLSNNSTTPVVGEGATRMHYTDRSCYEVLSVSEDGKTAVLLDLTATADKSKSLGQHGHQEWILTPTGNTTTVTWRNNAWRIVGQEIEYTKEYIQQCKEQGITCIGLWLYKNDPELFNKIYGTHPFPKNVVEGITKSKKTYSKINIVFGIKDYYYDWSF